MTLKQLKTNYRCVARPAGWRGDWWAWDDKKGKQVKLKARAPDGQRQAPLIGFIGCPCGMSNNHEKMYLVNGTVMHESCALGVTQL